MLKTRNKPHKLTKNGRRLFLYHSHTIDKDYRASQAIDYWLL